MRKNLTRWLLVTSMLAVPVLAHGFDGGHRRGGGLMKAVEELDLSAEQKKKLKEMRKGFKESMGPKRKAMETAHEELKTALQGTASDDEIRKKFEVSRKASEEFMRARFEKVLSIRAILTPEQRAKFKGLREGSGGHPGRHGHAPGEE